MLRLRGSFGSNPWVKSTSKSKRDSEGEEEDEETYVERQKKYTVTKPAKAPEEVFEIETDGEEEDEERAELWDEEQIEAWQHDRWLLRQELGSDY